MPIVICLIHTRLKQLEITTQRQAERQEAFVAPVETAAPTVEEKRRRKRVIEDGDAQHPIDSERKTKKKRKRQEEDA